MMFKLFLALCQLAGGTSSMQQLKERLEKDLIKVLCHLSLYSLICKLSSVVVKMTKICSSSAILSFQESPHSARVDSVGEQ